MITVDQALQHVLSHAHPNATRRVPVLEAVGAILAEEVISDIDSPPHDKAMMDGYAISAEDLADPSQRDDASIELEVIEEVTAGAVPTRRCPRRARP